MRKAVDLCRALFKAVGEGREFGDLDQVDMAKVMWAIRRRVPYGSFDDYEGQRLRFLASQITTLKYFQHREGGQNSEV